MFKTSHYIHWFSDHHNNMEVGYYPTVIPILQMRMLRHRLRITFTRFPTLQVGELGFGSKKASSRVLALNQTSCMFSCFSSPCLMARYSFYELIMKLFHFWWTVSCTNFIILCIILQWMSCVFFCWVILYGKIKWYYWVKAPDVTISPALYWQHIHAILGWVVRKMAWAWDALHMCQFIDRIEVQIPWQVDWEVKVQHSSAMVLSLEVAVDMNILAQDDLGCAAVLVPESNDVLWDLWICCFGHLWNNFIIVCLSVGWPLTKHCVWA